MRSEPQRSSSPDSWSPFEPTPLPPRAFGQPGRPDPEPFIRRIRIGFAFAGILAATATAVGLHPIEVADAGGQARAAVTAIVAVANLAFLALVLRSLAPARLVERAKLGLDAADPRERRPRREHARVLGLQGLTGGWANRAIVAAFLPVVCGFTLMLRHGIQWEPLAFSGLGFLAGALFQQRVVAAVRLAVEDDALCDAYAPRG